MKLKTTEDRIKAATKLLVNRFKTDLANCDHPSHSLISITGNFWNTTSNTFEGVHRVFKFDGKEIDFGCHDDEDFGRLTCKIADAICAKLKVKKNEILHRDTEEKTFHHGTTWYGGWDSRYTIAKRILVIRPCKGFSAINKKLSALGLKPIHFKDWYHADVSGKRSTIFSRHFSYYCESEDMCQKVLDYLKGKKKVPAYDFKRMDDLSDRERGEYYETEWYGHESAQIRFTDAKGHQTVIW